MSRAAAFLTVVALTGLLVLPAAAALSPPHLPPATAGLSTVAETQMEVSGPYANLRAKPTTQAKLLAKLEHATKVDILGKVDGKSPPPDFTAGPANPELANRVLDLQAVLGCP